MHYVIYGCRGITNKAVAVAFWPRQQANTPWVFCNKKLYGGALKYSHAAEECTCAGTKLLNPALVWIQHQSVAHTLQRR